MHCSTVMVPVSSCGAAPSSSPERPQGMRRGPLYVPGTVTLAQKPQLLPVVISPTESASLSAKTISLPAALQAM